MNDFSFYFKLGWQHIITPEALDHILFIAALAAIYMLKDWKQVLILITAFTLGHTITLILSTKQLVEVSDRLVEFLIPCTIAITAISNLFQKSFTRKAVRINYLLALGFGLIHGLAFANTLRMILASDQSFALSMFSFSVGLEVAQILIVFFVLLLSQLFIAVLKTDRRHWVIFLSAAVFALAVQMALSRWPSGRASRGRLVDGQTEQWFASERLTNKRMCIQNNQLSNETILPSTIIT
ncbi:MAG TPA: HupE/UreJ family protein [Flavisolibacter sp.]|nr:HupE/UreJ family protein [Flavisolibacter sp.]